MIVRRALKKDLVSLAKIVVESESTGHEIYSYSSLFEMEKSQLSKLMENVLDNEYSGQGLCYKDFIVAEDDGVICGGAAIYLEGENGSSNHLMTGALMNVFNRILMLSTFSKLKDFRAIDIDKKIGTYQLDSVAVFEEFRGKGVFKKIWSFIENEVNSKKLETEVQVWKNNSLAIKTYEKIGFETQIVKNWEENGRILMTKKYNG